MNPSQIIAIGGGGFSVEPDDLVLERYVLAATGRDDPRICFVPTASGDSAENVERFYAACSALPCRPSHLSLFRPPPDVRSFVLAHDAIYVGGGNTRNLLVLWREWGLDEILREAWETGIVLAGVSAGMICWFEAGVTDSTPAGTGDPIDDLAALRCLGFLPGSACPHYDGESARRPAYHRLIGAGTLPDGYAADDGVALHFVGRELACVVSSRQSAHAFRVKRSATGTSEQEIFSTYLGL